MKKVFYLLVAILAVAACSKEPMNTEVVDENPVAAGKTMTLKATLEERLNEQHGEIEKQQVGTMCLLHYLSQRKGPN